MKNILRALIACSALLLAASSVSAHHFFPRESDNPVSIAGTVIKFEWMNPHSRIFLDVADKTGKTSVWQIELGSPGALAGRGWTRDMLKPGDAVAMDVILWKGRANFAAARDVRLPDGRRMFAGSHAGDPRR